MPTFLRPNRLRAFGMVDAIVGIVILGLVAGSVAGAFSTLSRLDLLQEKRIDQLVKESDAVPRSDWY